MVQVFSMRFFLEPKLSGSHALRADHLRQAETIQQFITQRFGRQFDNPAAWKIKFLRAFLDSKGARSAATAYNYYRTVRVILAAAGRWDSHTENQLSGPWQKKGARRAGGRPALLPGGAARNVRRDV